LHLAEALQLFERPFEGREHVRAALALGRDARPDDAAFTIDALSTELELAYALADDRGVVDAHEEILSMGGLSPGQRIRLNMAMGEFQAAYGTLDEAVDQFLAAEAAWFSVYDEPLAAPAHNRELLGWIKTQLAVALGRAGRDEEAGQLLQEAVELRDTGLEESSLGLSWTWLALADHHLRRGDSAAARLGAERAH
jgi:tetratricopeptide (TPR) repeat protein